MDKKKLTLILLIGVLIIIYFVSSNNKDKEHEEIKVVEKIDEMKDYDYYLEDNASFYYKNLYDELKKVLSENEVDNMEYAKVVSKLFVTDLFTLDNKITSNDIGGLQFVYSDFKEDFINIAKTSIYASVENNIYDDRKQELPVVTSVDITNIEKSSFIYNDVEYESYNVFLKIEYEKDLGYPYEYNLVLIYNDKYLQVVKSW